MTQTFKCPSCSAPLEFEGKTMQKCRFCGSSVIVPGSAIQNSNVFGSVGEMNFGDFSSLTGKALKIAEIQQLIQSGNKIQAIKVFRETFGTGLKEAKDAVEAMERGEGIDISGMRVQTTHMQMNAHDFNAAKKAVKIGAGGAFFAFVFVGIIVFGVGVAVYFLVANSANKNLDRTFTSTFNTTTTTTNTKTSEKPRLVEEILKFGGEGNGAGKFEDNRHVAIDGDGRIYSGDYEGGKIQVFDASGKYLTQWTADPKMLLLDMFADRKGNVYILQVKGIYVYKGESGELVNKLESYNFRAMARTLDGKIVASTGRGITILDANLKTLREFKDAAEKSDSDSGFESIAVDGNSQIYAVDRSKGDICKFSPDGKFLNRFDAKALIAPSAIAIDNKGRIFASDVSTIYVFDAEGRPINSFGTTQAFGMVFNDADELFVAARPFILKYKINF